MSATTDVPRNRIVVGDALDQLRRLPDASVDSVITSPPYFRLRDYGADGQIGLEAHVEQWVEQLVAISAEVHRVLVPTGTYWLNLGDTYASHPSQGAAAQESAHGTRAAGTAPAGRAAGSSATRSSGPNPTRCPAASRIGSTAPTKSSTSSSSSRTTSSISTPSVSRIALRRRHAERRKQKGSTREAWRGPNGTAVTGLQALKAHGRVGHPLGKNPGDVWTIPPGGYRGAHHADLPVRTG